MQCKPKSAFFELISKANKNTLSLGIVSPTRQGGGYLILLLRIDQSPFFYTRRLKCFLSAGGFYWLGRRFLKGIESWQLPEY